MHHIGNEGDTNSLSNYYTYNYTWVDWTNSGIFEICRYKHMTSIINNYEGCLLELSWNRRYADSTRLNFYQIIRTTYTIKTHINFVHSTGTEFYAGNSTSFNLTDNNFITNKQAKDKFWGSCKSQNKYYWNPYKRLYFFMDTDIDNEQYLILTCFPYETEPKSACDGGFKIGAEPTFKSTLLKNIDDEDDKIDIIYEMVTFTRNTAYIGLRYYLNNKYQVQIRKLDFIGTSCTTTTVRLGTIIYSNNFTDYINDITYLGAIPNIGIGFALEKNKGINILYLDKNGDYTSLKLINSNAYWKLYQLGIDTTDEPPLFGLSSEDTNSIFRITNIATETYKNTTLNFYKYQLDVGRFHIMSVQPGKCDTIGTNDDYSNLHVVYVHMENKIVDL